MEKIEKATLEATDKNILESIKDPLNSNRNHEIKMFVEALEMIEGNMFISLDAKWGEGKTFYVRQIEKTLEYLTLRNYNSEDNSEDVRYKEMTKVFEETELKDVEIERSYFPVYYNAWLYDNHADPLISLLYIVTKECRKYVDTTTRKKLSDCFATLLSAFSMSIQFKSNFQISIDGEKISKLFKNKDILEEIKTAEEIREKVKEIFNSAIVEKSQKLVIFIDELDRCRPSYALEMLERIKHYFDDDRIIFIVSVNKEQLTHTISNYYGNRFDSTGYLNKFFDVEMFLPSVTTIKKEIDSYNNNQSWLNEISNVMIRYYRMSLRDALIFKKRIERLSNDGMVVDYNSRTPVRGNCLSLFIPIIIAMRMHDIDEARKFENGESNFLETLLDIPETKEFFSRFGENGYDKIKAIYDFSFKYENEDILRAVNVHVADIGRNLKEACLQRVGIRKI